MTFSDSLKQARLYHFTTAKFALHDIQKKRLKIAQFSDLNDPFELMCVDVLREGHEQAFSGFKQEMAKLYGVLCFSQKWKDILQWSHYGERHKGICLGFDVSSFESKFGAVEYKKGKLPFPGTENLDQAFMWKMLRRKYHGWRYEEEWRVFLRLESPEWNESVKRNLYFADFTGELALREVILGAENDTDKDDVQEALSGYVEPVRVSKIRLSPSDFRLRRYDV